MDTLAQLHTALAGRYDVEREVGAGGMATVYLARDARHDRKVALKVLKPELGAVVGVERFLAEIKVTANLQHPNLLPLFDSGEAEGMLFYVMPYVDGESLRARINREVQLPVDEAVRIASAVAGALDYAHRHGVIHRDLKPENILLHEGQPLVADFGIALALSNAGGNRITQTGISLGTPQYMSPEQATGDRTIDGRSDIYSLGAVLYEMLTGEPPHSGTTAQAIVAKVLTDAPRSIRLARSTVPRHVEAAVETALAKLPADRFSSAHQFAEALEGDRRATSAPSEAEPRSTDSGHVKTPARSVTRRRVVSSVPWIVALVATAAAVWSWATGHRAEPHQAVRFAIPVPPNQSLAVAPTRGLTFSPDGRTLAWTTFDSTGVPHLFMRRLDDASSHPVPGTERAGMPFFSPDGRSIAFFDGSHLRTVSTVSLDGGGAAAIADVPGILTGGTWSPKGKIVIALNGKLVEIPAAGGDQRTIGSSAGMTAFWPMALADGRTVLYGHYDSGSVAAHIAAVDLSSGKRTVFELVGSVPLGVVDGQLIYGRGDGTILTARFDARGLRVLSPPAVVVNNVVTTTPFEQVKAAVSPAGSLAYVTGSNVVDLVFVERGSNTLTPLNIQAGAFTWPRLSPDGRRIALGRIQNARSDIWIYEIASGTLTRLTSEGTTNDRPEWSPDGKRVLYRSDRGRSNGTLLWQPWDGTGGPEPLVGDKATNVWEGAPTPDGRGVVYRTGAGNTADIWYQRIGGDSAPTPIANTPFTEIGPRMSPDGKWVAYASNESGRIEVYVKPFPGLGARTQVSVNGGITPLWSRDGHKLYYAAGDQLLEATLAPGPEFGVASRSVALVGNYVFNPGHPSYDLSPDGRRFLLLRPVGGTEEIIVVHDWKYELRARAASK